MTNYSRYDGDFANAPDSDAGPPDGTYECKLVEHRPGTTTKGNERITLFMKIDTGPFKGWNLFLDWVLTEARMPYIRTDMVKLGFDLKKYKFSECVDSLRSIYGMHRFKVSKKTKDGFPNVYLDSRIESADTVNWPETTADKESHFVTSTVLRMVRSSDCVHLEHC